MAGVLGWLVIGPGAVNAESLQGYSVRDCNTGSTETLIRQYIDGTITTVRLDAMTLTITNNSTVKMYWQYQPSSGAPTTTGSTYFTGNGTFALSGSSWSGFTQRFTAGAVGNLSLYAVLTATNPGPLDPPGGCFATAGVGYTVLHSGTGGGTGGGIATPTPNPSPTATPTAPASNSPAPSGWCWDPNYDPNAVGTGPLVPCTALTPSPTPTATPSAADATVSCTTANIGSGAGQAICNGFPNVVVGDQFYIDWTRVAMGSSNFALTVSLWGGSAVVGNDENGYISPGSAVTGRPWSNCTYPSSCWVTDPATGPGNTVTVTSGGATTTLGVKVQHQWSSTFTPMTIRGDFHWVHHATPTPTPTATPTVAPTAPPPTFNPSCNFYDVSGCAPGAGGSSGGGGGATGGGVPPPVNTPAPGAGQPGTGSGTTIPGGVNGLGTPFSGCVPLYPKPGQVAYDNPVPVAFPGFNIDPSAWFNWMGSILNVLPTAFHNAIVWLWNALVDLIVPSNCLGQAVQAFVTTAQATPPFSWFTSISTGVTSSLAGGSGVTIPPLVINGVSINVAGSLTTALGALAPVRGFFAAGVYLVAAFALIRMLGSIVGLRAGGGSDE